MRYKFKVFELGPEKSSMNKETGQPEVYVEVMAPKEMEAMSFKKLRRKLDVPTYDSEGRMLTPEDYRWAYAVKRLTNTVFEPEGGERGIHFFDKDIANETIKAELLRRNKNKLTS